MQLYEELIEDELQKNRDEYLFFINNISERIKNISNFITINEFEELYQLLYEKIQDNDTFLFTSVLNTGSTLQRIC
jgi:phosphopantetheine adenylyltransferase